MNFATIQPKLSRYCLIAVKILSPPAGVHGRAPLNIEPMSIMGARLDVSGVHGRAPDQVLRSVNKHSAAPKPARARRRVLESPTRDQVTKLVHILLDDRELAFSERGDLQELVKRACAQADFLYNTVVVEDGIGRALAARGVDPAAADVTAARMRR